MNRFMFIRVCNRANFPKPNAVNWPIQKILVQQFRIKMRMEEGNYPFYYWDANATKTKEYDSEAEALTVAQRLGKLNNCEYSTKSSYNVPDTHKKLTEGDLELMALFTIQEIKDESS
jgi:hypothetical protein